MDAADGRGASDGRPQLIHVLCEPSWGGAGQAHEGMLAVKQAARAVFTHALAGIVVMASIAGLSLSGAFQLSADGMLPLLTFSAMVVLVAAGVTEGLVQQQRSSGRRDFVRPLAWMAVLSWGTSTYLLLGHPASLRGPRPVLSALTFACLLGFPFGVYWVTHWVASAAVDPSDQDPSRSHNKWMQLTRSAPGQTERGPRS